MDFLPIPDSCKERQWEVPFLDALPYDGQGFLGFLERSKMSEAALIEAFSEPSADARAHPPSAFSYVQQWLFFGVLAELYRFINVPFVLDDFKRQTSDGRWLVTTAHVPALISTAYESRLDAYRQLLTGSGVCDFDASDPSSVPGHELRTVIEAMNRLQLLPGAEESITHLATVRKTATDFFRTLENSFGGFASIYDDLVPPLMVSVHCLLELLDTVSNKFIPRSQWPEQYYQSPVAKNLNAWRYYYKEQLNAGRWCRNRLDRVFYKTESQALRYITSLLLSFEDQPHPFCVFYQCVVERRVNPTIPHHDQNSCLSTCHSFSVDLSRLNLMIESQNLPLVVKDKEGSFAVVAGSLDCSYTAITHVWNFLECRGYVSRSSRLWAKYPHDYRLKEDAKAMTHFVPFTRVTSPLTSQRTHGLGNSQTNALPLCQMERLFNSVQKIDPSRETKVWIDSLCVPAIGPRKTQAIAMLRDIYTRASEVLLIDSRLCRVSGSHAYETAIQFLCSEWLSRLWTFQEGCLARKLFIQFADGAISQETLVRDMGSHRSHDWFGLSSQLGFLLEREMGSETSWRYPSMSPFSWVLMKLQCRSTTVSTDEAICLANMLDITNPDPTTLPSMEMIYQNMSIPSGIIFLDGPRLSTSGFCWAPASFLNSEVNPQGLDTEVASLQKGGLLLNQCGILLDDMLEFRENAELLYWTLMPRNAPLQSNVSDRNIYLVARTKNTSFQLRRRQICDPAIILDKTNKDDLISGVLVSGASETGGTWGCEFEMTLDVWMPGQKQYNRTRELCEALNHFSDPIPCLGEYVENVQWLIG